MVNLNEIHIRPFVDKDWKILISWLEREGWGIPNTSILKLASEMKHCQQTVAVDDHTDIPLSYLSVAYFNNFAYIGLYITDPNYRGQGIGSVLWQSVMTKIGIDKNIHLKSEPLMTEKYRKSNFSFTSDVTCCRYVGEMNENVLENAIKKNKTEKSYDFSSAINETTIEKIIKYDTYIRGENMTNFFAVWLNKCQPSLLNPNPFIFTVFATNENDHIVGYGSIVLMAKVGRRIGPLLADNFELFLLILKELTSHKFNGEHNDYLTLTIPSNNKSANDFVLEANFKLSVSLDRNFTKKVADFNYDRIYCLTGHIGVPE